MTIWAEKVAELRIKHLEMLQTLITRMAGYGAAFKSYCITVTTAVIGFAFTLHRPAGGRGSSPSTRHCLWRGGRSIPSSRTPLS
jgi:hypothetical protein